MLWDKGSSYKTYIFKESTRHYAINYKGRGRKEVIYLRVANVSYVTEPCSRNYGGFCQWARYIGTTKTIT